jgi:hypothetical protein
MAVDKRRRNSTALFGDQTIHNPPRVNRIDRKPIDVESAKSANAVHITHGLTR